MHKTLTAIAALATVFTAVPVRASDPPVPTASVRIDDLDLSNPADMRLLGRRIAAAKESVCGSYAGARDGAEDRVTACRAHVDRQLEPRLAAARARGRLAAR